MAENMESLSEDTEKKDELDDFNRFIEKRRTQNKALKKIIDKIEVKNEESGLPSK